MSEPYSVTLNRIRNHIEYLKRDIARLPGGPVKARLEARLEARLAKARLERDTLIKCNAPRVMSAAENAELDAYMAKVSPSAEGQGVDSVRTR